MYLFSYCFLPALRRPRHVCCGRLLFGKKVFFYFVVWSEIYSSWKFVMHVTLHYNVYIWRVNRPTHEEIYFNISDPLFVARAAYYSKAVTAIIALKKWKYDFSSRILYRITGLCTPHQSNMELPNEFVSKETMCLWKFDGQRNGRLREIFKFYSPVLLFIRLPENLHQIK